MGMYRLSSSLMSNLSTIIVITLAIIAWISVTKNCAAMIETAIANIVLLHVLIRLVEYARNNPATPSPQATIKMEAVAMSGE